MNFRRITACVLSLVVAITLCATAAPLAAAQTVTTKTVAAGTIHATPLYIIDSGVAGPTVWVVGGTHGNEPAGYLAGAQVKNFQITRGKLIVVPNANKTADAAHSRTGQLGDLNRMYPTTSSGTGTGAVAKSMWSYMKTYRPTWLIDMHEAYDFHSVDSNALGQSAIYYPNAELKSMLDAAISRLNPTIAGTKADFGTMKYPIPGSTARAAGQFLGAKAFTLETSVKQTSTTRVSQQLYFVKAVLSYLKMK
jgi:predicted deacylase